jgi:uncharacterized Tic20 family protein
MLWGYATLMHKYNEVNIKVVPVHTIKAYGGSEGTYPLTLKLITR